MSLLTKEALKLLPYQFQNSPKIKNFLASLTHPLAEILNEIEKLKEGNYIEEAFGKRLDVIGSIIGQERCGRNDEDYLAWIKVRIRLNNGAGTPEDLLSILGILRAKVLLEEYKPHWAVVTLLEEPKVQLKPLFAISKAACPATTKCLFKRMAKDPFRFDFSFGSLGDFYGE